MRKKAPVLALSVLIVSIAGVGLAATRRAASPGAVFRFDEETLRRRGHIDGTAPGDEFATRVLDRFTVSAPGASGGGVVAFVSEDGILSAVSAADLTDAPIARFGESWADLGHPPGITNAMVIGAPGGAAGDRVGRPTRAVRPAVLVVEYGQSRLTAVHAVVRGKRGSLFGWRVEPTDSHFPEASFNGAFVVAAPGEGRGKRRDTGAVYKYDTETRQRMWRFGGERPGELAGYALHVIRDVDGDGIADVLVGAPGSHAADPPGRVYLLSGLDGSVLERVEAPEGAILFGASIATGSSIGAVEGTLIGAPGTPEGRKDDVGAVFIYPEVAAGDARVPDFDAAPQVLRGRRRGQWLGVSIAVSHEHVLVGSFEESRREARSLRGSVTAFLPSGKVFKTLRGRHGGDYFGRDIQIGAAVAVGAPAAPPLLFPR